MSEYARSMQLNNMTFGSETHERTCRFKLSGTRIARMSSYSSCSVRRPVVCLTTKCFDEDPKACYWRYLLIPFWVTITICPTVYQRCPTTCEDKTAK